MKTKLINLSRDDIKDAEYIGRWNPKYGSSVLGNPYKIGRKHSRSQVINKYRSWLWRDIENKPIIWEELLRLAKILKNEGSLTLACYCFPADCHGEIIFECLEWMIRENYV